MRTIAGFAFAALLIGCGPNSGQGPGGGDRDGGTSSSDGSSDNCGQQEEEIQIVNNGPPPDLLIVLDRSGSMLGVPPPPPITFSDKWTIMRNALDAVMEQYDENIKFGLTLFPSAADTDEEQCDVAPGAVVSIDLGSGGTVIGALDANEPANGALTPAHTGLTAALQYYESIPANPDGRYVLFATDGVPNCGEDNNPDTDPNDVDSNDETIAAVAALHDAGIKTFVVGFGGGFFGGFGTVLDDAAQEGGVPREGGPPYYYAANNQSQLEGALLEIAGGIIPPSCSFRLTSQPPDPTQVKVTLDGVAIPRDPGHNNGWDYHPNMSTITIFGDFCDDVESGAVSNVAFTYGCPGPVVE